MDRLSGPVRQAADSLSSIFAIYLECGNWLPLSFLATVRVFECLSVQRGVHKPKGTQEMKAVMNPRTPKMAKVELRGCPKSRFGATHSKYGIGVPRSRLGVAVLLS